MSALAFLATTVAPTSPALATEPPVAGTLDLRRVAGPARGVDERLTGQLRGGRAGSAVAFVGDIDHDGHQDYVVASPYARRRSGEVAVVYGPPGDGALGLGPQLGQRGFHILGPHAGAAAGTSVTGIGDINGDGYDDLVVGAPGTSIKGRGRTGAAFLVYGGPRPSGSISLRSLGTGGVLIVGAAPGDDTGYRVSAIGDLDADGRPELAITAPDAGALGRPAAGGAFVVYSRALGATVDLADLGGSGYRIDGAAAGDHAGVALASVGDMGGDGLPEIVLGAPSAAGSAGAAYVVWGKPGQTAAPVDLAALADQGFALTGQGAERAGTTVTGLTDATDDGTADIAVGAPAASPGGRTHAGAVYVISGRSGTAASALADAPLRIWGGDPREALGRAVTSAGDVDRDGFADLLVGLGGESALARRAAGATLLILTGRATRPDMDAALLGYAGLRLAGPTAAAAAGQAMAGGVDLNGDGRGDVIVGLPGARARGGAAAVVLLPSLPQLPATPPPLGGLGATNVEAIVDDSRSMARYDRVGLLRRQALELVLTNPANQGRVFGAVEFDGYAHQVLPPLGAGDPSLQGERLDVLRALLRERITNTAVGTNVESGFNAAAAQNPAATAHIFFTDGGRVGNLAAFESVPTYVIGLKLGAGVARRRLEDFAQRSGGRFYAVADAGELQGALAAIDAVLRGETAMNTQVEPTSGVKPLPSITAGEAAAAVSRPNATLAVRSTIRPSKARRVRRLRMVVTWDRRDSRFRISSLRLRLRGGRTVRVNRARLRRAVAGRRQRIGGGLRLKGHAGRTFLVLDVRPGRGRWRGRRAAASAFYGATAVVRIRRTRGSRRTVARSRWTYQWRPG